MRPSVLLVSLTLAAAFCAPATFAGAQFNAANPAPIAPLSGMILYQGDGFAIAHPPHWAMDATYKHDIAPGRTAHGVSFTVAPERAAGTNLGSDTSLSVERLPGRCDAARFLDTPEDTHAVTDGGRTWSVATASDAGAGNRYEETVYALTGQPRCFAVRYFIHYGAIQNYDPGAVKAFDRDALMKTFDRMRRSLAITK